MSGALLRIGELASRAEVSVRTVDHYTSLGLLNPTSRTTSNYRLYQPADAERIALIQRLEAHGVSLDDIARALNTPQHDHDITALRDLINDDLSDLQTILTTAATTDHQGLLTAIATRVHSLVTIALQIPPDLFLP